MTAGELIRNQYMCVNAQTSISVHESIRSPWIPGAKQSGLMFNVEVFSRFLRTYPSSLDHLLLPAETLAVSIARLRNNSPITQVFRDHENNRSINRSSPIGMNIADCLAKGEPHCGQEIISFFNPKSPSHLKKPPLIGGGSETNQNN
jgi:hypothetical protein